MTNRKVIVSAFGGPEVLQVVDGGPLPEPAAGEVRLRVEATSAVFTDSLIRRGLYPYLSVAPPFGLGYDVVGTIDALGAGVTDWQLGQRVADLVQTGGNADYLCRPAAGLQPVPPGLDPAEAVSLVLSYLTAYQLLHRVAGVRAGQRVLVHRGAGAVGTALVQLAREAGAEVVATASAGKLDVLRADGATAVDHRAPDGWAQLATLAPDGYDAVFDGVSLASLAGSYYLLRPGGLLALYGAVGPASNPGGPVLLTKELVGFMFGLIGETAEVFNALPGGRQFRAYDISSTRAEHPEWFAADLARLFALLAAGRIRPVIEQQFSLADAVRAHERLASGQVRGRLVFDTRL